VNHVPGSVIVIASSLTVTRRPISLPLLVTLIAELLESIGNLSPAFFERLVVDLIVAMGYGGGSRENVAQRIGKSGDGGIDGIVNEDPLGLDVVYLQAKRYGEDNVIGRDKIQQFVGP
jgi:restriction system protein